MSIAAGRAWMAAGQGLNNIGAMLLQQQDRERERQRQDEADKVAARNQQMREAAFTQETGLTPFGTPAPQSGVYSGGEYVPVMGKQLAPSPAVAPSSAPSLPSVGFGSGPGVNLTPPAPVATKVTSPATNPFPAIGAMVTGGQIPTPRSATQRADDEKLKRASMEADAMASGNPGFAARPWREQLETVQSPTLYNAFTARQTRDAAVASRAATEAEERQSANSYRARFGEQSKSRYRLTSGLSDKETIAEGARLAALEEADAQRRGRRGTETGGGVGARRQALLTVEKQVDDTRTDLAREEARQYRPRTEVLENTPRAELPAATQRFVTDSTAAAGRLAGLRTRADSLGGVRDQLAAVQPGMPAASGAGATQVQARARALELQGQGLTRAQIFARLQADGYNVQP